MVIYNLQPYVFAVYHLFHILAYKFLEIGDLVNIV